MGLQSIPRYLPCQPTSQPPQGPDAMARHWSAELHRWWKKNVADCGEEPALEAHLEVSDGPNAGCLLWVPQLQGCSWCAGHWRAGWRHAWWVGEHGSAAVRGWMPWVGLAGHAVIRHMTPDASQVNAPSHLQIHGRSGTLPPLAPLPNLPLALGGSEPLARASACGCGINASVHGQTWNPLTTAESSAWEEGRMHSEKCLAYRWTVDNYTLSSSNYNMQPLKFFKITSIKCKLWLEKHWNVEFPSIKGQKKLNFQKNYMSHTHTFWLYVYIHIHIYMQSYI